MSTIVSSELDYTTKVSNHSTINYRNIACQGSTTVGLSSTGAVGPTEFIVGPMCMSLAKSRIEGTQRIALAPAKHNIIDANWLSRIERLTAYDAGTNALLADINGQDIVAECLVYAHSKNELMSKPYYKTKNPSSTLPTAQLKTLENIQRSNTATANDNLLFGGIGAPAVVSVGDEEPFDGLRHTYVSVAGYAFDNNAPNVPAVDNVFMDFSIPLSVFKGTVLAHDNMIYSPTNIVIQLYWAPLKNYVVQSDSATALTTATDITDSEITALNFVVAVEANTEIISNVISKVMGGGISFNCPYISVVKQSIASSTAHNFTLQLTRAYGSRLLFIATAKFDTAATTAKHLKNHSIGYITRYQTTLNSIPFKIPAGYDVLKGDEYILGNRDYVKGSCIDSDSLFKQKFVHIDSFFGEKPLHSLDFEAIDGLDLTAQASLYGWEATLSTATASVYYTIIVAQKSITLSSMGATIV